MSGNVVPFYGPQPIRIWHDSSVYASIVTDPAWAIELKYDDWRCWVQWHQGALRTWSNSGRPLELPAHARYRLLALDVPNGTTLDGCLMGKRGGEPDYLAFDLPLWGAKPLDEGLDERRTRLKALGIKLVGRLPNGITAYERSQRVTNVEGIVCKRRDSRYQFETRPKRDTADWVKVKVPPRVGPNGRMTPKPPGATK